MLLIIGSFVVALFAKIGMGSGKIRDQSNVEHYITLFIYYVVNYFVVRFFQYGTGALHPAVFRRRRKSLSARTEVQRQPDRGHLFLGSFCRNGGYGPCGCCRRTSAPWERS